MPVARRGTGGDSANLGRVVILRHLSPGRAFRLNVLWVRMAVELPYLNKRSKKCDNTADRLASASGLCILDRVRHKMMDVRTSLVASNHMIALTRFGMWWTRVLTRSAVRSVTPGAKPVTDVAKRHGLNRGTLAAARSPQK